LEGYLPAMALVVKDEHSSPIFSFLISDGKTKILVLPLHDAGVKGKADTNNSKLFTF
jgi:hypothetical protein